MTTRTLTAPGRARWPRGVCQWGHPRATLRRASERADPLPPTDELRRPRGRPRRAPGALLPPPPGYDLGPSRRRQDPPRAGVRRAGAPRGRPEGLALRPLRGAGPRGDLRRPEPRPGGAALLGGSRR